VPRYHFHIRSAGGALIKYEEGVHLPDIDAAREEAALRLRASALTQSAADMTTQAAASKSSVRMGARPSLCPLS
jgi:hypothetical protein